MSAKVIPFKRDLHAELLKLRTLHSQMSLEELLERHKKINDILNEAIRLVDAKIVEDGYLNWITYAYDHLDNIAVRAGIPMKTVKAFNGQREDYKYYAAEYAAENNGRPWGL